MNILQEKCFAKGWLDKQRAEMTRVDPGLLEKSIHALELVGLLAHKEIPFSFKGGTCMLLLLENIRRLSIDVDISCTIPSKELEPILQEIGAESRFENFEPDHRDPDRLPKRSHYKFSYTSAVNGKPADILLDVMEEECLYPETILKPVATPFAIPEDQVNVRVPTIEGLTADKLTAFAPRTIGVRYSSYGSSMKILKHCSDVGALFDRCENMEELFSAYEKIWEVENTYRQSAFTREQVLDDTIGAARLVSLIGLKGCPQVEEVQALSTGISQLDSHIIGARFSRDEARVCAAKAAWLATALKQNKAPSVFPRYSVEELQELVASPLTEELAPLNRLKGGSPEAYYYWLKAAANA
jgi:hypothetical protein